MLKKIAVGLVVLIFGFLIYVSTRPSHFAYSRSGLIHASPEKIFPYISQFKLGQEWSPYAKIDPNMKVTYEGVDGTVGSKMTFEGNSQVGSGDLEVLKIEPQKRVDIKLRMIKPVSGENLVVYELAPEGDATRFTWSMTGESGFVGKLISTVIDCEKMIGGQFEEGISNLRALAEKN